MLVGDTGSGHMLQTKKKKKRSFLQKQKRFAKNGHFGRGTQLSSDMYEYFINIMKVMNSKEKDEEEMSILASNVFNEIQEQESNFCCNQIVSRIVENLLPFSTDEEFLKFIERFGENLRPLFCDVFGSHVLQQTIIVSYNKLQKCLLNKADEKLQSNFLNYILKVSNFLYNNLEDFIWDVYSNAVARTVFNVLSGNPVKGEVKVSDSTGEQDECNVNIPEDFHSLIKKFAKRILAWPEFNNLCCQPVNSSFLQSLLLASKKCEECFKIVGRIIEFLESSPLDLTDENNMAFVRLLEVVLCLVNEDDFKKLYKLVFKGKLEELATSKCGNFAVQKLIINCQKKKMFTKIFSKLGGHMKEILDVGHSGVLLALVKGCQKFETLQGECLAMLMRTFGASDTKDIVPLVASLTSIENFDPETSVITLHGSLIVEELLNFKKPINVVNSLLEMSDSKLVKMLSDVRGSHITDAFVKSTSIGEKSRDKLFKKLRGRYLTLAASKHGSRSLDAIWSVINVHQKALLAEELKSNQSELSNDPYGRGFARKIHLDNFRRNKEEWIRLMKTSENAEKLFADIIPKKRQKTS